MATSDSTQLSPRSTNEVGDVYGKLTVYEPDNCRWATKRQQGGNTRNALRLTFNGETHCLREWARRIGITKRTLSVRIEKWGLEKALTTPPIEAKQHQKHS